MPILPSGLRLALTRDALFDPGTNWFTCPPGNFWYRTPDPKIGLGPFVAGETIIEDFRYAPVPASIDEVKPYIRVVVVDSESTYYWPGDWLSGFPAFLNLDGADLAALRAWVDAPKQQQFLAETLEECRRLAQRSQRASGLPVFRSTR